jgi:glucose 1-dehydrogenase
MGELDGRVALVTGAGSGIGHAVAQRLGAEGAKVAVNYFHAYAEEAQALATQIGGKAYDADVSSVADVQTMTEAIAGDLGPIRILVNNAAIERPMAVLEVDEATWDSTIAVNLKGPFFCLQAAARQMRTTGGGSIVNISSVHEDFPFPAYTPYCASKGGLRMMMRNAAVELAEFGIRVNNVAPGAINTPINAAELADPAKVAELHELIPLERVGEPADVAEVVLFLASDRSSYVTGSTYYVDGGLVRHTASL